MTKRTYWFTVACGDKYQALAAALCATAATHGVEMHVLDGEAANAKRLKLDGILGAPDGYDRIAYLDADTLLVNPAGVEQVNGALKEPWGRGDVQTLTGRRQRMFDRLLRSSGMKELCVGGADERQEWNSGVIIGSSDFMRVLARKWSWWWDAVLDICDGEFIRDQLSFVPAYLLAARRHRLCESLPPVWNCCVRRLGFMPDARVLHKAGGHGPSIEAGWQTAKEQALRGCYGTVAAD